MGELINFPGFKKEEKKVVENEKMESYMDKAKRLKSLSPEELAEKTAINILDKERFNFILNLKRGNPGIIGSETYRNAHKILSESLRVDIAEMINNATEIQIKMKPAYFIAAFEILRESVSG